MIAYTTISAIILILMLLSFLYIAIRLFAIPTGKIKGLLKNKSENKQKNDKELSEKAVKTKLERAQARHKKRINYLRSFKKGKGLIFYLLAFPLFLIGALYSGKGVIEAIITAIARSVELLVLKYNFAATEILFNALPIYKVTMCILYTVIFLNAFVFVLSLAYQLLWKAFSDLKFKITKNEKVYLFGNNEQNKTIYKRAKIREQYLKINVSSGVGFNDSLLKREIRIIDDLSKTDENELFLSNILYKNIKTENSYVESIFSEIANLKSYNTDGKQIYTIIINTGNAEKNVYLTRLFVNKIRELDEVSRKICYNILHIYVYSDPAHESIYEEYCLNASGCLSYFNKYKRIALDFINKYPFSMFMNEEDIDDKTYVLKRGTEINSFLVGFGKTNQQIYLSSVANNQFLTTDENNMLVQKNVNYYIYDKSKVFENKNLNHTLYRYKHERKNYNPNDYLELPELPYNEFIENYDINDSRFYSSIKMHALSSEGAINFVIIAFGSDLENIDMAQKILEMSKAWGIENLWVFVKVRDSKNFTTFASNKCFIIGNEDETVFDLEQIISNKYVNWGIYQNSQYLLKNSEGMGVDEAFKKSKEEWFTKLAPILRYSNIYGVIGLRSKLNLMGFDYRKKENHEKFSNKFLTDINSENDLNNTDAQAEFSQIYNNGNEAETNANSQELYTIKPIDQMSIRDIFATLEHLRWNAFMIAHGMVPATIEEIQKPNKGKDYTRRIHGNITTMKGLIDYRNIIAKKLSLDESNLETKEAIEYKADVIKNDYNSLDSALNMLELLGYEIIKKKALK